MGDMKTLLSNQADELEGQIGVPIEVVASYPLRPGAALELYYAPRNGVRLGGRFGYVETGGRIDYRDYSGHFTLDHRLTRWTFGVLGEHRFSSFSAPVPLQIWGISAVRYAQTSFTATSEVAVNQEVSESTILDLTTDRGGDCLRGHARVDYGPTLPWGRVVSWGKDEGRRPTGTDRRA
jgi:hypothetical protein